MMLTAEDLRRAPTSIEVHLHKTARGWLLVKRPSKLCGTDRCVRYLIDRWRKLPGGAS